jgi:signal transduction histidine kinase
MEIITNFDLLSVGVVIAATGVLGFTIYFRDKDSITNHSFLLFSVITAFWGAFTYAEYNVNPDIGIWFLRLSLCLAVGQAYSLFLFFSVFPERVVVFSRRHQFILVPIVVMTAILTLTPYVLNEVATLAEDGTISSIVNGPAVGIFGVVSIMLVIWGLAIFLRKAWKVPSKDRAPFFEILVGTSITFALIITGNFVLPAFFNNARLVPFGSFFMFPFIICASYAILRERLFNVKVAVPAILVFFLAVVSFGEILFSNTFSLILFRICIFTIVLVVGINLIRSVVREVEQREKIQALATELQETNERQELLIHFVGHEVKGFLTKDAGVFSSLLDGDFGPLTDNLKPFVEHALTESRHGADSVASILKASNLKKGTVTYMKEPFDLKAVTTDIVEKTKPMALQRGLTLTLTIDDAGAPYTFQGDKNEIGDHMLRNLIENAINYTPMGSVIVSLHKEDGRYILSVKDSGIGIIDEDKKRLFTEGGHGKDSVKVNVHSTGYGLYIAKSIVEAHGGSIRAESEGAGKGSTFIVELPV